MIAVFDCQNSLGRCPRDELVERFGDQFPSRMWAYMWYHGELSDVIAIPVEQVTVAGSHDETEAQDD